MFSRAVTNNNFCNGIGDRLFPNISAGPWREDKSVVTVLRAMLGTRTEDYVSAVYTDEYCILPKDFRGIEFITLNGSGDEAEKIIKDYKDNVAEKLPGFRIVEDLAVFFKSNVDMPALFCINEEKKQTLIFAHDLSVSRLHLILTFTTRILPWYFEEDPIVRKGEGIVDKLCGDLVSACTKRDSSLFERAVSALYGRYNFREAIINEKLEGFESNFHKAELRDVDTQIERLRNELDRLRQLFSDTYSRIDKQTTIQAGLIEKIKKGEESDSEIRDIFLASKSLHLADVVDSEVTFVVATVINNYDPEVFEISISNKNAFWYRAESGRRYSSDWEDDQIEKFFRAIFEDEILKVKVCAAYRLNFASGYYRGLSGYNFGPEFADYMPNQHIQQYSCLGSGHEEQLREAMSNRNYVGAVNVCIASAGNISLQEVPTGEHHMKYLLSDQPGKCIILPDGSEVTPKEALAWLEANED